MATTCPHRGFNIYGPARCDIPDPVPGVNCLANWDPKGIHKYGINEVCYKAALMGSNIIRMNVWWTSGSQPDENTYIDDQFTDIKHVIDAGRVYNPDLQVLPVVRGVPDWIPDRSPNGPYVTTDIGRSHYAKFVAHVLQKLQGDPVFSVRPYANFIELANEPNGGGDGDSIPALEYGRMAAWALVQVDFCFALSTVKKNVLVGALQPQSLGSAASYFSQATNEMYRVLREQFYPLDTHPTEFSRIANGWRASCHPYPDWSQTSWSTALNKTTARLDEIINVAYPNKVWITEVSASSSKLTLNGQMNFFYHLMKSVISTRPRVEGLLFWPLNDAEPHAYREGIFHKMGCVEENNVDLKPSGAWVTNLFYTPDWSS